MRKVLLFLITVLFLCCDASIAAEVAGTHVPETAQIGTASTELVLNGAGVRRKAFVKVYVGALYLPQKLDDVEAIINDPGAKRITMKFLYTKVGPDRIIDNLNKGLAANNPSKESGLFQDILANFRGLFNTVYKGDIIRLDYVPEKGTLIWLNNDLICTVKGVDFYRALLKIWLGPKPNDRGLKEAMLGTGASG